MEDSGYAVTLSPSGNENAKCIIDIACAPTPESVSREKVQAGAFALGDQFVGASVEKKKVIREFAISGGGYGCYCVFTDASMVGQPSRHDEFKMVGVGIIQFSDDLMAVVSLAADNEKGSDFVAMLAASSSRGRPPHPAHVVHNFTISAFPSDLAGLGACNDATNLPKENSNRTSHSHLPQRNPSASPSGSLPSGAHVVTRLLHHSKGGTSSAISFAVWPPALASGFTPRGCESCMLFLDNCSKYVGSPTRQFTHEIANPKGQTQPKAAK